MAQIHQKLNVPSVSQDFGTQTYEQQVVLLEKTGEEIVPVQGVLPLPGEEELTEGITHWWGMGGYMETWN